MCLPFPSTGEHSSSRCSFLLFRYAEHCFQQSNDVPDDLSQRRHVMSAENSCPSGALFLFFLWMLTATSRTTGGAERSVYCFPDDGVLVLDFLHEYCRICLDLAGAVVGSFFTFPFIRYVLAWSREAVNLPQDGDLLAFSHVTQTRAHTSYFIRVLQLLLFYFTERKTGFGRNVDNSRIFTL